MPRDLDRGGSSSVDARSSVKPPCISVDENASPIDAIAELARHRTELDRTIAAEVVRARTRGGAWRKTYTWRESTWAEIGGALGVTGQAAQQRFGRLS